jgi:hypothetical protein
MKWGLTNEERANELGKKQKWHKWFAWHPIKIDNVYADPQWVGKWVWLETIERQYVGKLYRNWDYRIEVPEGNL